MSFLGDRNLFNELGYRIEWNHIQKWLKIREFRLLHDSPNFFQRFRRDLSSFVLNSRSSDNSRFVLLNLNAMPIFPSNLFVQVTIDFRRAGGGWDTRGVRGEGSRVKDRRTPNVMLAAVELLSHHVC